MTAVDRHPTSAPPVSTTPDVLIIGAGPAGLAAAERLARHGRRVLLVEREHEAGGIPRHCAHTGFGIRDLRRMLDGPTYARRLVTAAKCAGATIWTGATVTHWTPEDGATVTSPSGIFTLHPGATVLATGARERPRPARLIPGDRPDGIYTTGLLQTLAHTQPQAVGTRAVVLGAELVSWSSVLTLRHVGCEVVGMITAHPRAESYRALSLVGQRAFRVPVLTRHRVARIIGKGRLEAVELEDLDSNRRRIQPCDTLITTGDWIPDHELARLGGLPIDPNSKAPLVDASHRTAAPGVFAVGNLTHPVDTADIAALDGRHVTEAVTAWLEDHPVIRSRTRITTAGPLRWISPGFLSEGELKPARARYLGWVDRHVPFPTITVRQDGMTLARRRLPWPASPGRMFRIPSHVLASAAADAGEVTVELS
jgi:thioredoxin reductase